MRYRLWIIKHKKMTNLWIRGNVFKGCPFFMLVYLRMLKLMFDNFRQIPGTPLHLQYIQRKKVMFRPSSFISLLFSVESVYGVCNNCVGARRTPPFITNGVKIPRNVQKIWRTPVLLLQTPYSQRITNKVRGPS